MLRGGRRKFGSGEPRHRASGTWLERLSRVFGRGHVVDPPIDNAEGDEEIVALIDRLELQLRDRGLVPAGDRGPDPRPIRVRLQRVVEALKSSPLGEPGPIADGREDAQADSDAEIIRAVEKLEHAAEESGAAGFEPKPVPEPIPRIQAVAGWLRRMPGSLGTYEPETAALLMEIRDRVTARAGELPSREWLTAECTKALKGVGVSVVDEVGPLDEDRHEVVKVRSTHDQNRNEYIAETVRVGYETANGLLRPQMVVAWVAEKKNEAHDLIGGEGA